MKIIKSAGYSSGYPNSMTPIHLTVVYYTIHLWQSESGRKIKIVTESEEKNKKIEIN